MKKSYMILLILPIVTLLILSVSGLAQDNPEPALTQRLDSLETRIVILEAQVLCLQAKVVDPNHEDCDLDTVKAEVSPFISTPTPTAVVTETPEPTVTFTPEPEITEYVDGVYLVGTEIPAGTYRSPGGPFCYWERLSGLSGEFTDIIANEFREGNAIVEIQETDKAFKSTGCGSWTLVE